MNGALLPEFLGPLWIPFDWTSLEPRSAVSYFGRQLVHGHKNKRNGIPYSLIADWFALNSNELTWIALVTVGVVFVGMSM